MANPDVLVAIKAMNTMESILKSSQLAMIKSEEDKFIHAINIQLKSLQTYMEIYSQIYSQTPESPSLVKGFETIFMPTLCFYETGVLGKNVLMPQLKELVHKMLILLAENKLSHFIQAEAFTRVINSIIKKIIDHSNHTTIMCVLIKLLHDCAEKEHEKKYEELVIKYLWKII